jgi:hypothetical protein
MFFFFFFIPFCFTRFVGSPRDSDAPEQPDVFHFRIVWYGERNSHVPLFFSVSLVFLALCNTFRLFRISHIVHKPKSKKLKLKKLINKIKKTKKNSNKIGNKIFKSN